MSNTPTKLDVPLYGHTSSPDFKPMKSQAYKFISGRIGSLLVCLVLSIASGAHAQTTKEVRPENEHFPSHYYVLAESSQLSASEVEALHLNWKNRDFRKYGVRENRLINPNPNTHILVFTRKSDKTTYLRMNKDERRRFRSSVSRLSLE